MSRHASLTGLRVVAFESRRAADVADLIVRYGGMPIVAPAMRERVKPDCPQAREFADDMREGKIEGVILLTGVGTRALIESVQPILSRNEFADALGRVRVIARGPKPAAVLHEIGVTGFARARSPFTWKQVLESVDAEWEPSGMRIWVQEYGTTNPDLLAGLRDRGADVSTVAVYAWDLPDDLQPLREALRTIIDGQADVVAFTSSPQVTHVMKLAETDGRIAELREALARVVVASVGPMCSETLRQQGVPPDFEPGAPHMGVLFRELAEQAHDLLSAKQREI